MAEERDLPWGDPRAHWTPEQHEDWAATEAELLAQGWRPRTSTIEVLDTVGPPGIGWWICTESYFELLDGTAIDRTLTAAELRLCDREVRGLVDDEDRAAVYELRRARGRIN